MTLSHPVMAAVAGLLLLCAAGCSAAQTRTGTATNPTSLQGTQGTNGVSLGSSEHPMQVFPDGFDGQGQPLRNGGVVRLGPNVSADVFVDPYPATGPTTWLDLYLASDGQPITDAEVAADTEMTYMSHGTTHETGRTLGDGHYVMAMTYPMVGLWRQRLTIQVAETQYVLPLLVTVYPS